MHAYSLSKLVEEETDGNQLTWFIWKIVVKMEEEVVVVLVVVV